MYAALPRNEEIETLNPVKEFDFIVTNETNASVFSKKIVICTQNRRKSFTKHIERILTKKGCDICIYNLQRGSNSLEFYYREDRESFLAERRELLLSVQKTLEEQKNSKFRDRKFEISCISTIISLVCIFIIFCALYSVKPSPPLIYVGIGILAMALPLLFVLFYIRSTTYKIPDMLESIKTELSHCQSLTSVPKRMTPHRDHTDLDDSREQLARSIINPMLQSLLQKALGTNWHEQERVASAIEIDKTEYQNIREQVLGNDIHKFITTDANGANITLKLAIKCLQRRYKKDAEYLQITLPNESILQISGTARANSTTLDSSITVSPLQLLDRDDLPENYRELAPVNS